MGDARAPRRRPRREEILEVARSIVEREGREAATAMRVAIAVPISQPSIFYHFGSIDDLLAEVAIAMAAEEYAMLLTVAERAQSGVDALAAVLRARVAHYTRRPHALELVYFWAFARLSTAQLERLYPLTNAIFDVVEAKLNHDSRRRATRRSRELRRQIVAAWVASEGVLLTQVRLRKTALRSKHTVGDILDALVEMVTVAVAGANRRER